MTNSEKDLFNQLNTWKLDNPESSLSFSKRLARENGWTHQYARRVTEEYKKFIFLAVKAGHPVTPSEAVDQAWHLHLTYTKSYWEELCEGILQQKLHHNPTRGGKKEDSKFEDWYTRTLDSYQHFFGSLPPASIWPQASERFQTATHFKRIDTSKVWLLPKPRFFIRSLSFVLIALLSGILIGCSGDPVATGLLIGFAAIGLIIFFIIWITLRIPKPSASRQKHRKRQRSTTSGSNSSSSDSSSSTSHSDFPSSSSGAAAAGFAGFGGGFFGGGGAGGDYSDSNSNDSSSSDSSSDSGGDSGSSSGCSSGCGGGGD